MNEKATLRALPRSLALGFATAVSVWLAISSPALAQDNRIDTIRADAPDLAAYGKLAVGVKTIQLVNPKQLDIVKAKAEPSIIPASMAEPALLAHIAINKFMLALPLYRQEFLFNQQKISLPRITLARWMIACGNAVMPIINEIKK